MIFNGIFTYDVDEISIKITDDDGTSVAIDIVELRHVLRLYDLQSLIRHEGLPVDQSCDWLTQLENVLFSTQRQKRGIQDERF